MGEQSHRPSGPGVMDGNREHDLDGETRATQRWEDPENGTLLEITDPGLEFVLRRVGSAFWPEAHPSEINSGQEIVLHCG